MMPRPDNERAPAAGAKPPAEKSAGLQLPPPPANLSSLPEADFATMEEQFFGYIFSPASYDTKFWAHGERDMIKRYSRRAVRARHRIAASRAKSAPTR